MVFPLIVLLTFGAVEYGLIYKDELRLTSAARSGARIGTADKNTAGTLVNADDDYQILQAVYSALGPLASKVIYVSIFNAGTNPGGTPPAGCNGPNAASVEGANGDECDVWAASDFNLSSAGVQASPKYKWLVANRGLTLNASLGQEPTYLGVYIQTTHNYVTGLFGSSRTVAEKAVFRFEPIGNTSHGNYLAPTTSTTVVGGATTTTGSTTTTTGGGGSSTTSSSTTSTTHASTTSTSHASSSTTSTTHAPTSSTSSSSTSSTIQPTTTTTTPGPTTTIPYGIPT